MMIWYSSDIIEFPIFNVEEKIVIYLFVVVFELSMCTSKSSTIPMKNVDFRLDQFY